MGAFDGQDLYGRFLEGFSICKCLRLCIPECFITFWDSLKQRNVFLVLSPLSLHVEHWVRLPPEHHSAAGSNPWWGWVISQCLYSQHWLAGLRLHFTPSFLNGDYQATGLLLRGFAKSNTRLALARMQHDGMQCTQGVLGVKKGLSLLKLAQYLAMKIDLIFLPEALLLVMISTDSSLFLLNLSSLGLDGIRFFLFFASRVLVEPLFLRHLLMFALTTDSCLLQS